MCSTEKCVDEHRRQKVYLKPEHLRLKLQDDEEIGAATLGWLDAHGFSGSQARPRPLPRPPTPHFRHRARACPWRAASPGTASPPRLPPPSTLPPRPRAQKTRLTYRELVKDPQGEVSRLYRFLGVDPKPPVRVNATMKMDTASRLADEIENLHEVEEALRGTSYLKELYDLQFFGYADR